MKKLISAILVLVLALSCFAGCAEDAPAETKAPDQTTAPVETNPSEPPAPTDPPVVDLLPYAKGTTLRMACGYNNAKTGMRFDASVAGEGITLADGKTYKAGEFKPTWATLQENLGIVIEDLYQGNSATNEFKAWKDRLGEIDVLSGNVAGLNEAGTAGSLINLAEHLDKMPNFKAYLEANPIVRLSITSDTDSGAIYFSPYFDGVSDIERMPLMRTDWVKKLLNGEGEFTATASDKLLAAAYEPYMPTSGKVEIDVVKADGSATEKVTKDYDKAGNIVKVMNDALAAGDVDGVAAVNMLRKYIDEAYNGYYGTNRADLFIGQNAAWDADELVALLRCIVANSATLNADGAKVQGLFARENANNQRRVDMYRLAGHLFGVRGLESRQDWLYSDKDGILHDARQEKDTYLAMERMNAMAKEGLIGKSFLASEDEKTESLLKADLGFMHYDYNQTQTIYNGDAKGTLGEGEEYMAVMVPVARWNDGTGEQFMRFTESWRSVKTDGWGLSKTGIGDNTDKLNAALKIIDYAYSQEGMILMSYGPDAFIKTNADGSYVTFDFNGEQLPVIADATFAELQKLTGGNYTNYARQYLGSTLTFVKLQSFEYQCTSEAGKIGAGYISNAIKLGTIKHPELGLPENMWYASMPTVLPTTQKDNEDISAMSDLGNTNWGTGKNQVNVLVDQIVGGYTIAADAEAMANKVATEWSGELFLMIKQAAFDDIVEYYKGLNK